MSLPDLGAALQPPVDVVAAFEDGLIAIGRVHVGLPAISEQWNRADAAWAGTWASRPRLHNALQQLHTSGTISLPSRFGVLWDRAEPPLPQRVTVPANRTSRVGDETLTEPWVPAMSWARSWIRESRPPRRLREDAVLINRWFLKTTGKPPARVAREERSLHVFNDEKRLAGLTGGAMFATDQRLTLDALSCDRPLGALPVAHIAERGPVLVVENKSTFDSAVRALRHSTTQGYAAVVFGAGDGIAATIHDLMAFEYLTGIDATRFDYAGDVDRAGVEIAGDFASRADAAGLPWSMATSLWEATAAAQPTGPDRSTDTSRHDSVLATADRLGLPDQVRHRLQCGVRVPQERVDRTALSDASWWNA